MRVGSRRRGARLHVLPVISAIEAAIVDVIISLIVLKIIIAAAVVERAIAATGGAVGGGRGRPSDVVETGLTRKLAAAAAASPRGCAGCAGAGIERRLGAVRASHHGANAAKEERASDDARCGRSRGAQKRTAATGHRRTACHRAGRLTGAHGHFGAGARR